MPNTLSLIRALLVAALIAAFWSPALAVEVPALFAAEVPLDEQSDDPRNDAYEAALRAVLLRVSGSDLVQDEERVTELFPLAASYVTQFRPGEEDSLWVAFDGQAIEKVLRNAGHTVWGKDRPLTLVWLAVDWGQGERELIGSDDPERLPDEARSIDRNKLLRERMLEIAERRGLPLLFPLLDTIDLQSVTFSDIWGGFDEPIIAASERYEVNSILIGRIRPSSRGRENWSYYFGNDERSWNGPPEAIVAEVADLLAAEFAVGGNAPIETVELTVSGIVSVEAYGGLQQLLSGITLIESYRVTQVAGDRVTFSVDIRGGAERLRRALRFNALVEQEMLSDFGEVRPVSALEFYYEP